jgi:hypothetical protein
LRCEIIAITSELRGTPTKAIAEATRAEHTSADSVPEDQALEIAMF